MKIEELNAHLTAKKLLGCTEVEFVKRNGNQYDAMSIEVVSKSEYIGSNMVAGRRYAAVQIMVDDFNEEN